MIYPLERIFIKPVYNLWLKKVSGINNIPHTEPFIIAANHSSYYDTILAYTILIPILNKPIHSLGNSKYWNNFFFSILLNWGRCIPLYIERDIKSMKKNEEAMRKAVDFLKEGHLIQIFPEGTRSHDGKLQKAYTGVAKLCLTARVPVLPFGIIGSNKVIPRGKLIPRLKRAEVKIGKPLYFDKYYGKEKDRKTLEIVTRKIMQEIGSLIGQKYNY